ncbi:hypothetical protein PHSC3_000290 [Chlamydiales bacterium STE3]|nr:hypothetical protein PHSC3_000290 [Chlamydiales bacterium STE3]
MFFLRKIALSTLALVVPIITYSYAAEDALKSKMYGDLDFIKNTFKIQYTPLEWKATYSGWDLDVEVDRAKSAIALKKNITVKDFQKILKNFLNSTNDYHVSVRFYSTESSTLPLKIKGAEGRYFITHVEQSRLSPVMYPIKEGDELISYNGLPIAAAVREFKEQEIGGTNEYTAQAMAEVYFTNRVGAEGHSVPRGPAMISVKSKDTGKVQAYQIMWNYTPEKIKSPFQKNLVTASLSRAEVLKEKGHLNGPLKEHPLFKKLMLSAHFLNFKSQSPGDLGARRSFVPTLGEKIWESDCFSPYYAYLFETVNGKKIGYLRLPHFVNFEGNLEHFKSIIGFFESSSDALVIDQVDNPGGSLFYLYALVSLLTEQPVFAPRHIISLTQKEIAYAVDVLPLLETIRTDADAQVVIGGAMEGNKVTFQTAQFFLNYLQFLLEEWNQGKITTAPTYLWGIDYIPPNPEVHYTKPILLLINNLDFSGGDFFPAILQDNKRATLFGSQTAGAGGYVLTAAFPNLFGIESFNYTASLAQRHNNQVIENLGVKPDVSYEITVDDLQNNYRGYAEKVLMTLETMLLNN